MGSGNCGKYSCLKISSRNCEVPCPATLPLISLLQILSVPNNDGKTWNLLTWLRSHSLSHLPTECREPSVPILVADNPTGALTSVSLFWLSAEGSFLPRRLRFPLTCAAVYNLTSLTSNCYLCLRHLTSHYHT
jgi:hypothetical protein